MKNLAERLDGFEEWIQYLLKMGCELGEIPGWLDRAQTAIKSGDSDTAFKYYEKLMHWRGQADFIIDNRDEIDKMIAVKNGGSSRSNDDRIKTVQAVLQRIDAGELRKDVLHDLGIKSSTYDRWKKLYDKKHAKTHPQPGW